jgi:cell surface protein SprA
MMPTGTSSFHSTSGNRYDYSLRSYPYVDSRVQITRVEVWVTNRQNRINAVENNSRNIVAIQDLGEARLTRYTVEGDTGQDITDEVIGFADVAPADFYTAPGTGFNVPPDNENNGLDPARIGTGTGYLQSSVREIVTLDDNSFRAPLNADEGQDYAKLENARKLSENEYSYHPQLGYISLNQRLSNDEVLAVAYQYTIGDEVYQVGEFANGGVNSTNVTGGVDPTNPTAPPTEQVVTTQSLILKMLKSSLVSVDEPVWDLMMKNVYQIPGAYQLAQEDFRFNILYTDPSPLNYITQAGLTSLPGEGAPFGPVADTPLLKVFNLDRLNYTNDPQVGGDGFFDFVPNLTIDTETGKIIFTTVEPFGQYLYDKLDVDAIDDQYNEAANESTFNDNQRKYVFRSLYKTTQAEAMQESEKNKFLLRGRFTSTGGDGISVGAFNLPQGSVVVTAGGRILVEGVDYTVNYQLGRVQILDPSLQASNTPIEVSVENNSVFGQQTRRFAGFNVEHKFSEKFLVGATLLNMSERPFTQKTNYGQESVNNTIFGLNTIFSTEVPFFTRLVNKLPNMDTDVPSNFSFRGEVAYLKPGSSKADQFNGEATTYVDDFEGSQTNIDMRGSQAWSLSSAPVTVFSDGNPPSNDLSYGYKRAKLAWYSIDPTFFTSQRPSGITDDDLSSNRTRRIYYNELYPVTDVTPGQSTVVNTLDLSYFPQERGPYNFNPVAAATNSFTETQAVDNWGGIMRSINSTNFEQANVEYIQFWMLDPYLGNPDDVEDPDNTGTLEINLGEISEDILKDNRKQYENGLPAVGGTQPTFTTVWGKVPVSQSLIYAFDTDASNRTVQDVGYDGLNDAEEAAEHPEFAFPDPAADNYQFFLTASGDVIDRYKNYNNVQGNSPVDISSDNRGNTTLPDAEDVNRDNTMNTIDAYYRYIIPIGPNAQPGVGYVVDERPFSNVPTPNGESVSGRWLLYKIPVEVNEDAEPDRVVGGISSIRSIRFMRMFMTGFRREVTLRFGALDLVRGEWRRYVNTLDPLEENDANNLDNTGFDVVALNIQENGTREPIPYVSPPGVVREQLYNNNAIINQNEQALSLRVYDPTGGDNGLEPGDSRAVFKNVNVDMRQFKKLRMFIHAEELVGDASPLLNGEMKGFVRFGNDFTENFYHVELLLDKTELNESSPEAVWRNQIDVSLEALTKLKIMVLQGQIVADPVDDIAYANANELDPSLSPNLRIGIKGNPNFGLVRTLMLGVKNANTVASGRDIRGEVWFNELRLSDMDSKGGMAAVANMDTNFADFATISATGRMSTIGFGTIEQGPNERSREDVKQYDIVTNFSLGKLLPKKWYINLPFNYGVGEEIITPEYDPFQQDVRLEQLLDITTDEAERDNLRNRAIDYTKRKSINFIGVKKERAPEQKQRIYDPENLTLSYSFNEMEHHDYEIEDLLDQQVRASADYTYTFNNKPVEPFKNSEFMKKSQYWKILSDFNFNYLPQSINFSSTILRQFNRQQFRNVEVEGIPIDPLYRRNYFFNYQYGFNYNITRALKFNYTAATSNIVRNYLDEDGAPIQSYTIWKDFWNPGEANNHNQHFVVNYDLPIYKIPALKFIKATYTYDAVFNWQRSSEALRQYEDEDGVVYNLGNLIQNNNTHGLNSTLNLDEFYKYIGLTAKKPAARNAAPAAPPKPGEKVTGTQQAPAKNNSLLNGLIGVVTSVKNISVVYSESNGTSLPGYLPGIGFFGTAKPGLFVLGSQDGDLRYEMARKGYLTNYQEFNQNFTQVSNKTLRLTAQVDPFPDFRIELTANREYQSNHSEQYFVDDNGVYQPQSPYSFGNFGISTIMIKTAFSQSDVNMSEAFNQMRENRIIIADRLAEAHYGGAGFPRYVATPGDEFANANVGYPVGFGRNSQQVLLPAFIAAYTGTDAGKVSTGVFRDVPLPNWNIKYTGLMRYKFFKDRFRRFSVQHGYKASYNVNSFRSDFESDSDTPVPGVQQNFRPKYIISNINLMEQFNPLIRIDVEMKNSIKILAEIRKDRTLNMSFDNNLLTEVKGNEYIIGLGYRIKDVTINTKLADNPQNVIKSDVNIKADFSWRKDETIVRYLDYDNNQLGGGQDIWSVKLTADYAFSKNLTAIFYYDHTFSKAVISTSYPLTNIRSGFTLRYNFGN